MYIKQHTKYVVLAKVRKWNVRDKTITSICFFVSTYSFIIAGNLVLAISTNDYDVHEYGLLFCGKLCIFFVISWYNESSSKNWLQLYYVGLAWSKTIWWQYIIQRKHTTYNDNTVYVRLQDNNVPSALENDSAVVWYFVRFVCL